jgi:hypothetical protein
MRRCGASLQDDWASEGSSESAGWGDGCGASLYHRACEGPHHETLPVRHFEGKRAAGRLRGRGWCSMGTAP